ncbi:unnamed protein product [Rotaria magnacalcarata]|uniref:Cardiolipin synthase N-terminal domain-containing protein n=2 Tax=Rotaria magnacalcarata TaxID=392030 RepID=A0A816R8L1_9BILA|nr:unnamed protein product [Rotaria magnacalcarata]CAF1671374.1 unnamed protein product [Rotaria magnacalcarata]CAF2040376.1 unnamed protein product [Rotaria magnacalcarata]CAF2070370.1 unnamed protein product [Rotaria magnacalcarata]CAF2116213.1 unnamed protein product [Rotaria magnacalcarata]
MDSTLLVAVFLILSESISVTIAQDDRVIIGSSLGGFLGLIILILDLIAVFELLNSSGHGMCSKLIWILIIIFFPIGGLILYWCCARRRSVDQVL